MNDVGIFFDENSDFYDQKLLPCDYYFMKLIKNNEKNNATLLDIGGGNGNFSKLIINNLSNVDVTIMDPSKKLLSKIDNPKIHKVIGKLPDNIPLDSTFDYIHIKEVIHHITGKTVGESNKLLKKSLKSINGLLNENGFLLIHELFHEGHLIKKFPSYLIFYLLIFQNKSRIKIPTDPFILDLYAYFYTRKELCNTLKECGFEIVEYKMQYWKIPWIRKFALVKNSGRILIVCKKTK